MWEIIASFGALLSTIAAACSAYFSRQSARAAETALKQSRTIWQEDLLQKLLDRWDSQQMIRIRVTVNRLRLTDPESAKRHLRQILDYFDLVSAHISRNNLAPELVNDQLGYWIWAYYQVWQQQIAEISQKSDIHWDKFDEVVEWIRKEEGEDMSPDECNDFVYEEANLVT